MLFAKRCVALVVVSLSCAPVHVGSGSAAPAQTVGVPLVVGQPPRFPQALDSFMTEHYFSVSWARDVMVVGDLDSAREPLLKLSKYVAAPELATWNPWLTQLQSAAKLAAQATTVSAAAMRIAEMGAICGDCHRSLQNGPPVMPIGPALANGVGNVEQRMQIHDWADERLWEGLTTPSEEAWLAGAEALSHLPQALPSSRAGVYQARFEQVQRLGQRARQLTTSADRSQLYGELLGMCASCHVSAGIRVVDRLSLSSLERDRAALR